MKTLLTALILLPTTFAFAQYDYEPSSEHPFGRPNPNAPEQIKDYDALIGTCECISETRKADKSWAEPMDMIWTFKYIQNGMAVQDETLKPDGSYSGSIRQYSTDSAKWYVHYYSFPIITPSLSTWEGNLKNGNMVLYRKQAAPNGMEGYYRLTFSEITNEGFNWIGEWVDMTESIFFPTWKISCKKRKS